MGAFASTDVTVTVAGRDREIAGAAAGRNQTIATVTFGNGSLTYATGGVPMPAIGTFGFRNEIKMGLIEQPPANGFFYKYDAVNRKIKIFTQGFTSGSTTAGAAESGALVLNSLGVEATAPRMPTTAVNTVYDMGPLVELANGATPAAVTMNILFIGD
ncbi:MAG: hypothetical protein NT047_00825 [Deltaproteobacteria bacterium]|nr:hypothetical protein [Deltaproteobacteria bacterium]